MDHPQQLSRRAALRSVAAAGAALAAATTARAQDTCAVFTPATQAATTPDQALAVMFQ